LLRRKIGGRGGKKKRLGLLVYGNYHTCIQVRIFKKDRKPSRNCILNLSVHIVGLLIRIYLSFQKRKKFFTSLF
jgi:hypothetical protein